MHDSDGLHRRQKHGGKPNCRVQLLVHPPLQLYLVARTVLLSMSVAVATASLYVSVDWYVAGRVPTALSFVPLAIAIVVTTPLVVWSALVASQKVAAPFVRLAAWVRQTTHSGGPAQNEPLRLRAGDPSAELVMAIQQAIVELNTASTDERFSTRHEVNVLATAVSIDAANVTPPLVD